MRTTYSKKFVSFNNQPNLFSKSLFDKEFEITFNGTKNNFTRSLLTNVEVYDPKANPMNIESVEIKYQGNTILIKKDKDSRLFELFLLSYILHPDYYKNKEANNENNFSLDILNNFNLTFDDPVSIITIKNNLSSPQDVINSPNFENLLNHIYKHLDLEERKSTVANWMNHFRHNKGEAMIKYLLLKAKLNLGAGGWANVFSESEYKKHPNKFMAHVSHLDQLNEISYKTIFEAKHPFAIELKESILFFNKTEGLYIFIRKDSPDALKEEIGALYWENEGVPPNP